MATEVREVGAMKMVGFFAAVLGGTGALLAIAGVHGTIDAARIVLLACAVSLHMIGWTQLLGVDLFAGVSRRAAVARRPPNPYGLARVHHMPFAELPVPARVAARPHAECRVRRAFG